ncbi:MAG: hypothetical protein LBQ52_07290 [Helicobacteraceae bacterium]|jgi:hypothetical protein|nr:hypothetical protein [Helicobacteraceae bacterium]
MVERIAAQRVFESDEELKSFTFINCSLDFRGKVNLLFAKNRKDNLPKNYKLIILGKDTNAIDRISKNEYHFAMQIANDRYCFIRARSRHLGENRYEKNCEIVDGFGAKIDEFFIGDGIEDAQTNANSELWVSYFDEGVYSGDPFGQNGLNCFNIKGDAIYSYNYNEAGVIIDDCYALNVVSKDTIWIYVYNAFRLIKIKNKKIEKIFTPPEKIRYWRAFAIHKDKVLIYASDGARKALHFLCAFDGDKGKIYSIKTIEFYDKNDEKPLYCYRAQKEAIYFWQNDALYKASVINLA